MERERVVSLLIILWVVGELVVLGIRTDVVWPF